MAAMKSQKEIESKQPNLEEAAEPTAFAFGSIMNHQATLHSQDQLGSQLCELGRSLGRLIYWRDAIDDYNDDIASNSFNPLRYSSRESLTELTKIEFTKLTSLTSNIPWLRNRESIISILDHSALHHADMMSSTSSATRRKKKKSNGKWYENCDCFCGDCCSCPTRSGGSVSCCDLGDCGCCPCDGCSC